MSVSSIQASEGFSSEYLRKLNNEISELNEDIERLTKRRDARVKELSMMEKAIRATNAKKAAEAMARYVEVDMEKTYSALEIEDCREKPIVFFENQGLYNVYNFGDGVESKEECDEDFDENVDLETIKEKFQIDPKIGDIVDTTGYRHYGWKIVGKGDRFVESERPHVWDTESGITIPLDVTKHMEDPVSKYSSIKCSPIVCIEMSRHHKMVDDYEIPDEKCYLEYHIDDYQDWHLYAIDKDGNETELKKKK